MFEYLGATYIVLIILHRLIRTCMCKLSQHFKTLGAEYQIHASNLVLRTLCGFVTSSANLFYIVKLFLEPLSYWKLDSTLNLLTIWSAIHVLMDLFDLSNRKQLKLDVVGHHLLEYIYYVVFLVVLTPPHPFIVIPALIGTWGRLIYVVFGVSFMFDKESQRKLYFGWIFAMVVHGFGQVFTFIISGIYFAKNPVDDAKTLAVYWTMLILFNLFDLPIYKTCFQMLKKSRGKIDLPGTQTELGNRAQS